MAKQETKRFLFNCDWDNTLSRLPDASYLNVIKAVIAYVSDGNVAQLDVAESIAFDFIRKELDWNDDKYEEKRRRRSEAGKKGMANRWHNNDNKNNNVISVITSDNKNNLDKYEYKDKDIKLSNDNIEKEITTLAGSKEKAQAHQKEKF